MSCTKFTVNLYEAEPHSDLKWRYFKFLYLLDPVGEGDEKIGNIQMSSSTGLFYVNWEHVPNDDEFQCARLIPTRKPLSLYAPTYLSGGNSTTRSNRMM